jgi:hypothetical protein
MAFGIYHTPEEFVAEAVKAGHPSQWSAVLPQVLEEAVDWNMKCTPKQLCQARLKTLSSWSNLTKDFSKMNKISTALPEHARPILRGKRILLWKTLLERHGYDDMGVVDELVKGADLVGSVGHVPSLTSTFKPATKSLSKLKEGAKASREATRSGVRGSGDREVDTEVYNKTLDEKADSWISGPINWEDSLIMPSSIGGLGSDKATRSDSSMTSVGQGSMVMFRRELPLFFTHLILSCRCSLEGAQCA